MATHIVGDALDQLDSDDVVRIRPNGKVNARTVRADIADWVARLNALYARLDEWVPKTGGVTVERSWVDQEVEPPMSRFGVLARSIPSYALKFGRGRRVAFVPGTIWIVGANGRVDVTAHESQHILFDLGGRNGAPSDWQLVVDHPRKVLVPFGKTAFLSLLRGRR
jgi:hypothetical protein